MGWPEWTVIGLAAASMAWVIAHGDRYKIAGSVIGSAIHFSLLYAGGFFS